MKIAVEGCAHGELEKIYQTIEFLEKRESVKVDLLICCGDFQSVRTNDDLESMAVPPKFRNMGTFYKYFTGEKQAPILTVFVGGNHEASSYLQQLPYGGWVAHNIYYMGYAGIVDIAGIKIGGISGIYKYHDYKKGRFERSPYTDATKRSVYHIRELDVFRLKQYSRKLDIFLSHDWPSGVWNHGDLKTLLKQKPFFRKDIENYSLGSRALEDLLDTAKPEYWFAAHLHCKFSAIIRHCDEKRSETKFLALDKCLPRRNFLQILDVKHDVDKPIEIHYDVEWLTILRLTNGLLNVTRNKTILPDELNATRCNFTPTNDELSETAEKMNENFQIEKTFNMNIPSMGAVCTLLKIDNPLDLLEIFDEIEKNESLNSTVTSDKVDRPSFIDSMALSDLSDDGDVSESVNISTNGSIDENGPESNCNRSTPVPKRFKRRNGSIYQSCGEPGE